MADNSKSTEKNNAGEMPSFDFTKLLNQFRLPGVDFAALVDRERKNIEALVEANKIAFEGWQALVRRQSEILQETMKQAVADARQEDAVKKRTDLAKQGFEKALSNMPQPSANLQPVSFSKRCCTSSGNGAPPELHHLSELRSAFAALG